MFLSYNQLLQQLRYNQLHWAYTTEAPLRGNRQSMHSLVFRLHTDAFHAVDAVITVTLRLTMAGGTQTTSS